MKKSSKIISIRSSDADLEIIKRRADETGQSVSRYLVENALCDCGLTQSKKQGLFYSISKIKDSARNENYSDIIEECNKLWQLLK